MAISMYLGDYNDRYGPTVRPDPVVGWKSFFADYAVPGGNTRTLTDPYIKNTMIWHCYTEYINTWAPSGPVYPKEWKFASYAYNGYYLGGGLGTANTGIDRTPRLLSNIKSPTRTVLGVEWFPTGNRCSPPSKIGVPSGCEWVAWDYVSPNPKYGPYVRFRHNRTMNVLFCDGRVRACKDTDADLNNPDDRLWDGSGR
jgi:prepilin-type processing-associated H-X9-DG protein